MLSERSQRTDPKMYDSIYTKCSGKAHLQYRQQISGCLRLEWERGLLVKEQEGFLVGLMEMFEAALQ